MLRSRDCNVLTSLFMTRTFVPRASDMIEIQSGDYIVHVTGDLECITERELIRCRDCFWYAIQQLKADETPDRRYKPSWCDLWRTDMNEDDFCSYGKKYTDG